MAGRAAREIVAAFEALGVRLRVNGGRVDLKGASEPPRALLDELRACESAVLAILRQRDAPPPVPPPAFEATFSTFAPPSIRIVARAPRPRRRIWRGF